MKNSSRFDAAIATNLTRSSSGLPVSAASSSTRSLKASQDSSRLKNSCLPAVCVRSRKLTLRPDHELAAERLQRTCRRALRAASCSIVTSPVPSQLHIHGRSLRTSRYRVTFCRCSASSALATRRMRGQFVTIKRSCRSSARIRQVTVLRTPPAMIAGDVRHDRRLLVGQTEDLRCEANRYCECL